MVKSSVKCTFEPGAKTQVCGWWWTQWESKW